MRHILNFIKETALTFFFKIEYQEQTWYRKVSQFFFLHKVILNINGIANLRLSTNNNNKSKNLEGL